MSKIFQYYTDYPIYELGDKPYETAPIRKCIPLTYDRNKYCNVLVEGFIVNFKAGYIYTKKGRYGDVNSISLKALNALPVKIKEN